MKYYIKDIVSDTYSNSSGYSLLNILKKNILSGNQLTLSFKDSSPTSSSFLNSSIGELLDEFGFDKVKSTLRFVDLSSTQAQILKNYFKVYKAVS